MAKRRYAIDEAKIARYFKEGRGTGHGGTYRPWLTVQDVPSLGLCSRIHGLKSGREHHLLSNLESALFHILEWSEIVVDIREQFPLDREVTRMLATEMGIAHPRDVKTGTDLVMTTDFVVDVRIGQDIQERALAVKPADELAKPRTLEKLELDRRYWLRQSVPWHVVTDRDLPRERVKTLRWLHEMRSLDHLEGRYPDYWRDRCDRLLAQLQQVRGGLIEHFLHSLEECDGFSPGEPMTVLRHLAANRVIGIDLDRPFSSKDSIDHLRILQRELPPQQEVA
jgi:hypothetical protein